MNATRGPQPMRSSLGIKSYASRLNETGKAPSHTVAVNQLKNAEALHEKN